MNRNEVTEMIMFAKVRKGIRWADVAKTVEQSKEWKTTSMSSCRTNSCPTNPTDAK